jgi:hypothetical protein
MYLVYLIPSLEHVIKPHWSSSFFLRPESVPVRSQLCHPSPFSTMSWAQISTGDDRIFNKIIQGFEDDSCFGHLLSSQILLLFHSTWSVCSEPPCAEDIDPVNHWQGTVFLLFSEADWHNCHWPEIICLVCTFRWMTRLVWFIYTNWLNWPRWEGFNKHTPTSYKKRKNIKRLEDVQSKLIQEWFFLFGW